MHRSLKSDNKLCYARDVEYRQRIHRQKLATMRPTSKSNSKSALDNNAPQRHRHLELKLKKRQLDDEQYTKIERENRILMEKMYSIMKSTKDSSSMEFRPGLRINKSQGPMVDCYLSQSSVFPGQAVRLDSLNRESRRRDYMRIMEENMSILKRIQDRKPNYARSKWEKERGAVEGYLKNIKNDATTGYLSRSQSKLPMSPLSASSSRSSVSSSRKRLHGTRLTPLEKREVRTAPPANALPPRESFAPALLPEVPMGEINPLPSTAPAMDAPVSEGYRVTTGGEVERVADPPRQEYVPAVGEGARGGSGRPASAAPLFKKGYKIGGGHYLVQFFCDDMVDGTTSLRIRGFLIGAPHGGDVMQWTFSEARMRQMFGFAQPWNEGGDPAAWFNGFLVQLKEEDAERIKA